MVFNSYTFLVFFAIIFTLHHLPFSWRVKKVNLLLASYVFYAAWNPPFILLLWLSTVVDFYVGRALYTQENVAKRKILLVLSLIGNLGMLVFFKYGLFLLDNFVSAVNVLGLDFHPARPNIILPAGISFYTFTTLCYTIDMYKKHSKPVASLLDFSLFVTFFPHLVAGPIVRPMQLVPQFETPRTATERQIFDGLLLLSVGLFLKVVLADALLAGAADSVFGAATAMPALDAWIGVLAFSGQIFCDFAGYSVCAVGVALCLGFVLPVNFNAPYAAIGFSDFWRRWHITLSAWLRDYLYIPLGGNRRGVTRTYFALMTTMLLGGLWHGANWTFVAWGGLHGLYLCVERMWRERRKNSINAENTVQNLEKYGIFYAFLTFMLVNITWVFFRAPSFGKAWTMLGSMFGLVSGSPILTTLAILKVSVVVTLMFFVQWAMRRTSILTLAHRVVWWRVGMAWATLILLLIWTQESGSSFIYFQF